MYKIDFGGKCYHSLQNRFHLDSALKSGFEPIWISFQVETFDKWHMVMIQQWSECESCWSFYPEELFEKNGNKLK